MKKLYFSLLFTLFLSIKVFAQHAIHFKIEAEKHEKQSRNWLIATGLIGLATLVWGYCGFASIPTISETNGQWPVLLRMFSSRIAVFFVLTYMLVWAARNYSAHQHNLVINQHRQNSLNTFETFIKAASDQDIKNAILLQTTTCIFGPQASGYANKENEMDGSNKIIEVFRSAGAVSK